MSSHCRASVEDSARAALVGACGQPATNFILTAIAPALGELRPEMVYVDLRNPPTPGEGSAKQVDVTMDWCTTRVHGAVRDAEGTPLPLARIIAGAAAGRGGHEVGTDARGDYDVCIPGWRGNQAPRTLLARADGYTAAEVLAPNASGRVDFSLVPEAVVSGQVVAPPDNRPVPGARVSMTPKQLPPATETPRTTQFQLVTDAEGRFEFRNLPADRYSVEVDHDASC